jgi:transposase
MLYVGIDIAKRSHEATILDESGKQLSSSVKFANSVQGIQTLLDRVKGYDQPVAFALEATGHYWLALYARLMEHGYAVAVLNPLQTDGYRKSFVRKLKSDTRDSWLIADLLRIGRGQATVIPDQQILQLRELARFRFSLVDQIGDLKRKVLSILDRVFPEYETLFTDIFRKGSRAILNQAATADELAQFDLAELTALLASASRGQFGEEKARQIKRAAEQSLGVSFLADACQVELRCLLSHLDLLETQIALVDEHLARLLEAIPEGRYLLSIKGIGAALGAVILGEIGDVARFASPEKLIAYAGLDPTVYRTGQFVAEAVHLSKRGSPYLRRAIWLAAGIARHYNTDLEAVYQRKMTQGKHHNDAIAAVGHRLLNRVYIVLKQKRPYATR